MLLDKPGRKTPQRQAASRVRCGAPAAPSPPHDARGPAPPQAPGYTADIPSGPRRTGLASAIAPEGRTTLRDKCSASWTATGALVALNVGCSAR